MAKFNPVGSADVKTPHFGRDVYKIVVAIKYRRCYNFGLPF